MHGKSTLIATVAALAAGFTIPAFAGATTVLKSNMTGAQIVNDAGGAPRGVAHATVSVNPDRGRLCFQIDYSGLGGKATAGYLRRGRAGQTAMPMATLFAGRTASPASGCVRGLPARGLRRLERKPQRHYVDLATRKYAKGAVRGQLRFEARQVGGPPSGGAPSGGSSPGRH